MRFIWIFLLAGCSLSGQINKMQVLGLGSLTSAQRDGITVPSDRTYFIYNSTTGEFEYNQGGTAWNAFGSSASQELSFTSPNLSISDGNTIDLSALQDGTGTDNQTLFFSSLGNTLSISGGNSVSLPLISWGSVNGNINPILDRVYSIGQEGLRFDQIHGRKFFGTTFSTYSLDATEVQLNGSTSATALNGIMYYDTSVGKFKGYENNQWVDLVGLLAVENDTAPKLGADLDLNLHKITGLGGVDIVGNLKARNLLLGYGSSLADWQVLANSSAGLRFNVETGSATDIYTNVAQISPAGDFTAIKSVLSKEFRLTGTSTPTIVNGVIYYDNSTAQLLARVGNVWHDLTAKHKAEVITTNVVIMDGWKMVNDKTNQANSYQFTGCEPGERLTIYINRASAPVFTGTGLLFNLLPNSEPFASNTEMAIYLEVAYDGTTVDYYYQSR